MNIADNIADAGRITRRLTCRYLLALGVIAIIATFAMCTLIFAMKANEDLSSVINVAGRQRMLSQKIPLTAYEMAQSADSAHIQEFRDSVQDMRAAHQALAYKAPHPHFKRQAPVTRAINEIYFDGPDAVAPLANQFFQLADRINEKASRGALSVDDEDLASLIALSNSALLEALEEAVSGYESYGVK